MEELRERLQNLKEKLKIEEKHRMLRELEVEAQKEELWQDWQKGQKVMQEIAAFKKEIKAWEMQLFLSGLHDRGDALLSIHAGQGGVEAMDWSEMLLRMYTRYIERRGWRWEEIDQTRGEEAGIKSVIIQVL